MDLFTRLFTYKIVLNTSSDQSPVLPVEDSIHCLQILDQQGKTMKQFNISIVGCGFICDYYIKTFENYPNVKIVVFGIMWRHAVTILRRLLMFQLIPILKVSSQTRAHAWL